VFDRPRPFSPHPDGTLAPVRAQAVLAARGTRVIEWIGHLIAYGAVLLLGLLPGAALGWGATGHAVIALIADQHLTPVARQKVHQLLAADTSGLADPDDIGDQANWADRYRDSHGRGAPYQRTHRWHFVNLDLHAPDLNAACYGRRALRAGRDPAAGPARACVVDKILQFRHALADPASSDRVRLRALQFLLHLVGDVHQPLHASNDGDAGGNDRRVSLPGLRTGSLHYYWDTEFVEGLAARIADGTAGNAPKVSPGYLPESPAHRPPYSAALRLVAARAGGTGGARQRAGDADARMLADLLLARMSDADLIEWSIRDPEAWAWEAHRVAKKDAYGRLRKPDRKHIHRLSDNYARHASAAVALQLSRAGIRLAGLLNEALAAETTGL
jgi:S1/P1 Nuclease